MHVGHKCIDQEIRLWSPQPEENKLIYFDGTVLSNQDRMQADPFEMSSSNCRTS